MHNLNMYEDDLTAKVGPQYHKLSRDCEGQKHDCWRKVWAVDNEEDESWDREDQGKAAGIESRKDARCEGTGWGGSREAAQESGFFIVDGVDGSPVRREEGGVRRGH